MTKRLEPGARSKISVMLACAVPSVVSRDDVGAFHRWTMSKGASWTTKLSVAAASPSCRTAHEPPAALPLTTRR